jgi:hypothetical protein
MNMLCCKLQVFQQGKQCQFEFFIINNLPTPIEYAFQTAQSAKGGLSREQKTSVSLSVIFFPTQSL